MAEENALAQEEIDALLQAANISDDSSGGADKKTELADKVADEFLNSAIDIFTSLLGNDVSVEKTDSGPIPIDILTQEITEPVAVAFIEPGKGLKSAVVLVFDEKKMTVATDLVLMGEGTEKEKFSDDDIDALKEAVNQTMGNLGQNLTSKYSESISFEQADVQLLTPGDAIAAIKDKLKEDSFHNVLFSLKIADKLDTPFRLLLPLSIEDELSRLEAKLAASQPAAVPAVGGGEEGAPADTGIAEPDSEENLNMILDLSVDIIIKLGEAVRPLSEITSLVEGNILSLDKASNAPVEIIINNTTIAKGELIIIPPYNFAVKVTEVKERLDRIKNLSFH